MDKIKLFREYTRQLEFQLANINKTDCCCCNVTTAQCFAIVEIGRHPGISIKELSIILHMDKSSVSRIVDELVAKEYIERKNSQIDRRWVVLNLLPKGKEHFEKIEHDMYIKFAEIFEQISEEKQEQVIESLQLYVAACERLEEKKND